jgi:hypothetical protein
MSDLNVCSAGGWIVSNSEWLPAEPFDYAWPSGGIIVGCNQLKCTVCGEHVDIQSDESGRNYRCKCETWHAVYALQATDPLDPISERTLNWRCQGHPLIQPPATVDGIQIDANTNWKELAREIFSGARDLFPHPKTRNLPAFWMNRVRAEMPERDAEAVSLGVSELLTDPDPRVRSCVLGFFDQAHYAPGVERVVDAARDHLDLFLDVPDPFGGTLFMLLNAVLVSQMSRNGLAMQLLKEFALRPPGLGMQIYRLQMKEPAWFVAHAEKILEANPGKWEGVLNAIGNEPSDRLVQLAQTIRGRGFATVEQINAAATQHLSVPKAAAIKAALAGVN